MPLLPMRVLLDHAAENEYGVGAFNVEQYGTDSIDHGSR